MEVLRKCEENNIRFIALPPNATHLLQPLDVAYFRPMKSHWRKVLSEWKQTATGSWCTSIPKDEFPKLLKNLMTDLETGSEQNLKAGFKKTGIVPFDRSQVLQRMQSSFLQHDTVTMTDLIGGSFIEHLKKKRDDTTQKITKRRKKLNVPPGKSISSSDVNEPTVTASSSCIRQGKTEKRGKKNPIDTDMQTDKETDTSAEFSIQGSHDSLCDEVDSDIEADAPQLENSDASFDVNEDYKAGQYVLVNYEGERYPGRITKKTSDGFIVSAKQKTGKVGHWKWPQKLDEIEYSLEEMVQEINPSQQMSSRGIFAVPELGFNM